MEQDKSDAHKMTIVAFTKKTKLEELEPLNLRGKKVLSHNDMGSNI